MTKKPVRQEDIDGLNEKLNGLKQLIHDRIHNNAHYYNRFFTEWYSSTEYVLADIFGERSPQVRQLKSAVKLASTTKTTDRIWESRRYGTMQRAVAVLMAILTTLNKEETHVEPPKLKPPAVFIAHGGKTEALEKLQVFIRALGIMPLIAEQEASEGRSVDTHVKWCLDNADCAIILGTADDKNLKNGKLYPRPNVHIEIGRIQERFPNRVVYLLEQGAYLPSNISEKIYERFTQQNMDMAFVKIARELTAFGILHASVVF
jgi:predicted nucleotide-binding protein